MSMYVCSCKNDLECKGHPRIIVSGMMTQEELDFAKENRERIADLRLEELKIEEQEEKLWEEKQEKLIEQNMKLLEKRNQDKIEMILLRKLEEEEKCEKK